MGIKTSITNTIGRTSLRTKANSPHIFFAVGMVGFVGSTVLACRATLKLDKTIDEIKIEFEKIHIQRKHAVSYTDEEYYKDLMIAYLHGANRLIKLYGLSAIVGTLSIAALTGSHVQLTRRNAALGAALTAVARAYDEYRSRVRDEFGEEKEKAIYQGCLLDSDEIDEANKTGQVVNHASPYGRFFERNNINWVNNMELNRLFIQCAQNHANHRLSAYGHVFLNEVYDALGLERTSAGAVVGWIKDSANGDGHIDFGLWDPTNIDFINGNANGCFLDFNVDGVMFEDI